MFHLKEQTILICFSFKGTNNPDFVSFKGTNNPDYVSFKGTVEEIASDPPKLFS